MSYPESKMKRQDAKGAKNKTNDFLGGLSVFAVKKLWLSKWISIPAFLLALVLFGWLLISPASASPQSQQATSTPQSLLSIGNDVCLGCHGQPGLTIQLDNGDVLELVVNPQDYADSIHGEKGYACVQCHTTIGNYPHPPFSAADARDASLQLYPACYRCHSGEYERTQDSVHAAALSAGKRQAAICTDCHTAHTVRQLTDPATHQLLPDAHLWIPQTCAKCHNAIYQKYLTSIHGSALTTGNPDVPTCIDCHGVHSIEDPTTAAFRLNSPQLCAKCHTDAKRMAKYGISTEVLNTYVADFHGTTVVLFEKQSPDAETNKPVCFDCHGIHDIQRVDDPQRGLEIRQNLLACCQQCHPDATADFPDAWLSHYYPSPEKYPMVYYVNLFYKIFIPTLLGGMAILVAMDLGRMMLNRYRKPARLPEKAHPPQAEQPELAAATAPAEASPPGEEAPPSAIEAVPPQAEETPPAAETPSASEQSSVISDQSSVISHQSPAAESPAGPFQSTESSEEAAHD